jgi:hypothetical protein
LEVDVRKPWWSDVDNDEFDEAMREVIASSKRTPDRIAAFISIWRDAIQAQRRWAMDLEADILRRGSNAVVTWFVQQQKVMFSHDGEQLTKNAVVGIRRTTETGEKWIEQALIEVSSWDAIEAKRQEYLKQERAYSTNAAMCDKVLALQDLAPGSANPREACEAMGTSFDEYLGGGEIAA